MTTATLSLRDRAERAWDEQQAEEARRAVEYFEWARTAQRDNAYFLLTQRLRVPDAEARTALDDAIFDDLGARFTVDGLMFDSRFDSLANERILRLHGVCPTCGRDARSRSVESIGDLGQLLETFEAESGHRCDPLWRDEGVD